MRGVWFDHRRTARLRDEAPAAYGDIDEVMKAQRELTRIERRLHSLPLRPFEPPAVRTSRR